MVWSSRVYRRVRPQYLLSGLKITLTWASKRASKSAHAALLRRQDIALLIDQLDLDDFSAHQVLADIGILRIRIHHQLQSLVFAAQALNVPRSIFGRHVQVAKTVAIAEAELVAGIIKEIACGTRFPQRAIERKAFLLEVIFIHRIIDLQAHIALR